MLIEKMPSKIEDQKQREEMDKKIKLQFGGWLIESHCWSIPEESTGMQSCHWCNLKRHWEDIADIKYPLCRKNPAIIQLLKKYRKFYMKTKSKKKKQTKLNGFIGE